MKSPFRGMDPYLEKHWRDVHARLILYTCDQVEDQLPDNLIARVEERVVFETEDLEYRGVYPDVRIAERASRKSSAMAMLSRSAVAEPVIVHYRAEPATETFINILDPEAGHRLVTVIEILSLANKLPGEGQRQYRQKQREMDETQVSLVEIDLLRKGDRVLSVPLSWIPRWARTNLSSLRASWMEARNLRSLSGALEASPAVRSYSPAGARCGHPARPASCVGSGVSKRPLLLHDQLPESGRSAFARRRCEMGKVVGEESKERRVSHAGFQPAAL